MRKSNYVVWPAPSSKFLKMARGPKSLATPALEIQIDLVDSRLIWLSSLLLWRKYFAVPLRAVKQSYVLQRLLIFGRDIKGMIYDNVLQATWHEIYSFHFLF